MTHVDTLDPHFEAAAAAASRYAWTLPDLSMREKAFVSIATDLCAGNTGLALATHVEGATRHGVTAAECLVAVRYLAPYVGQLTTARAVGQLRREYPEVRAIDGPDGCEWGEGSLTPRERALIRVATDVLNNQTVDETFELHLGLAVAAGAGTPQLRAVLLLTAEYGTARAWHAYQALRRWAQR
ncbi:carboxymuconolactone decarboxylase family protein [Rugosimonospora africana]|uniref:Carboxymuconolactone decarboxylase n=1 Tax=Rugosimonospora africana TaxID=556532 RepID=A0A8J3VUQ1_9ACTN|nr:carboxymuconolactone decarboxylase family protein [Rugosimonospora africana]GIH18883.1 carboxymuconolactone decarboxylase [Rugosimonospora africana]